MLCLLALACADEINRIQSTVDAVVFGHYELGEVATEPGDMPAQSEDVTLRDVKFINKISATESLFVTEKNVTWKYDEEANTLTKITYSGDKTYDNGDFVQSGTTEYGFSKHLLRMYVKNKEARLVVVPNMADSTGEFTAVPLETILYDASKPPIFLYLDAETEGRNMPSVLLYATAKEKGKDGVEKEVGKYVLNSFAIGCEDSPISPVKLGIGDKFNLSASKIGAAGLGSDSRSFWVLTDSSFALVVWHGCTVETVEGAKGNHKNKYDYQHLDFKSGKKLSVSYKGESASKLPLGVWIDVSNKEHPVIEGKIISISAEGKLLSADVPSVPQ